MEIVGEDGHLVVDGGQLVGLANGVGDERGVVDALGKVAFVAREQQDVFEIEVARLEHAHHLKANGGFSVERDRGGGDELLDEL